MKKLAHLLMPALVGLRHVMSHGCTLQLKSNQELLGKERQKKFILEAKTKSAAET